MNLTPSGKKKNLLKYIIPCRLYTFNS